MKLTEVAAKLAPPGTIRYFQRSQQQYTVNDDGSIDIHQDFEVNEGLPDDFPKINRVFGDFFMNTTRGELRPEVMPFYVDGNCKVYLGDDQHAKSSQFPRSTHGAGHIFITGTGTLEFDDETLFSYKDFGCSVWITGGLEHAPRVWTVPDIRLLNVIEGVPPNLTATDLSIKCYDKDITKNIHKRFTSLNLGAIHVSTPHDAPLLGFLRLKGIQSMFYSTTDGFYTTDQQLELNNILRTAVQSKADIFEVQEQMIDAGFGKNAKL